MKMGTVIRNIPRTPIEKLDKLQGYGVATVHEVLGRTGLMKPYMRPITHGQRTSGNALTVLVHPGDNTMIHVAIEVCKPGDILVVAVSADSTDGMVGDLMATSMKAHGARGIILDTGCRDVNDLVSMGFPVWSRAISAKGAVKGTLGQVNTPIVCAGAFVAPGDVVVADEDGVVVIPFSEVDATIAQCELRIAKEKTKRAQLHAGELRIDIDKMRPWLKEQGIAYYDSIEAVAE
jgi:4-hydroxy-4-methyl-2-oxoglutarate aldolase